MVNEVSMNKMMMGIYNMNNTMRQIMILKDPVLKEIAVRMKVMKAKIAARIHPMMTIKL